MRLAAWPPAVNRRPGAGLPVDCGWENPTGGEDLARQRIGGIHSGAVRDALWDRGCRAIEARAVAIVAAGHANRPEGASASPRDWTVGWDRDGGAAAVVHARLSDGPKASRIQHGG